MHTNRNIQDRKVPSSSSISLSSVTSHAFIFSLLLSLVKRTGFSRAVKVQREQYEHDNREGERAARYTYRGLGRLNSCIRSGSDFLRHKQGISSILHNKKQRDAY